MRVCFISTSLAGGGAERFTANIANCLSTSGFEVYVLTGSKTPKDYKLNQNIVRLDALKAGRNIIHDIIIIRRLSRKYKFDVIIGIDLTINICVSLANLLFKPKVIISERSAPMSAPISQASRILRSLSYPLADGYVFQTSGAMEFYSENIREKSVIIYNPIKEDLPCRNNVNKKEIVAIGRLRKEKNYELLINAFAAICMVNQDYILRIFGDGYQYGALEKQVERIGIKDRVVFEGFCSDPHNEIVSSDIYVLTSLYEGMPNSLMEAMAMGFPVISTDCPAGGPAELIRNMENGLLIDNNNLDALINAMEFYINNPEKKNEIGRKAMEIRDIVSSEVIIRQWVKYIEKVLKR